MCTNCFSLPHKCEISMLCSSFYALPRSQHHPPSLQADWLQMRSGLPVNGQVSSYHTLLLVGVMHHHPCQQPTENKCSFSDVVAQER